MTDISKHLKNVSDAARNFLSQVNNKLNMPLSLISLEECYSIDEMFDIFPPVYECKSNNFVIVTGTQSHYLIDKNINCSYYEHNNVVYRPNVDDSHRSFCNCTGYYHCKHPEVRQIKSRPQKNQRPLCKIWLFEQELCCRVCVFEKICRRTPTFLLPCDADNSV
jgi:hypothetical protein